jgi:DNA-binding FadR family transcriptional regulator
LKASEAVARDIVNFITEGGFQPGDMLPREQAMQDQFQVGRGSLREALRLLEVQELIWIKPGVSGGPVVGEAKESALARMLSLYFRVSKVTYDDVANALLILGPLTARHVARNPNRAGIKEALDAALIEGECRLKSVKDEVLAAAKFHQVLNGLSGNPILGMMASALGELFSSHIVAHSDASQILSHCRHDHVEIAQAIKVQDSDAAAEYSYNHMKRIIDFHRGQVPGLFSQLVQWR